jgi:hypothetical protein
MKTNKTSNSAIKRFQKDLLTAMAHYYRQSLSENIKRGSGRKKLSSLETGNVKNSKVYLLSK